MSEAGHGSRQILGSRTSIPTLRTAVSGLANSPALPSCCARHADGIYDSHLRILLGARHASWRAKSGGRTTGRLGSIFRACQIGLGARESLADHR